MYIRLTNSLTRRKEVFVPADPGRITMYVCGPTVYSRAHIGNFRPLVIFDVLARLLRLVYGRDALVYASNITDIDDKIISAAAEHGVTPERIAQQFEAAYLADGEKLGCLPPDIRPRATGYIRQIISMIQTLEAKDAAYARPSGVLMRVASVPDYGQLSGRDGRAMRAGARIDPSPDKDDPQDFYVWKAALPDDPPGAIWESPWGKGRPGWHIECSAMVSHALGEQIDIHGGGIDLVFPHHENEMAQSRCAHGTVMARYWLHNGHVHVDEEKMSKSAGNMLSLDDMESDMGVGPLTVRLGLLSAHYRSPLNWSQSLARDCQKRLDRLHMAAERLEGLVLDESSCHAGIAEALAEDLNTSLALSRLSHLAELVLAAGDSDARAQAGGALIAGGRLLGVFGNGGAGAVGAGAGEDDRIESLVALRDAARSARDWSESDRIRAVLLSEGIELSDTEDGTRWRRVRR